jgi:hypothetical protein
MAKLFKKLSRGPSSSASNLAYLQMEASYSNASTINVASAASDLARFVPGLESAVQVAHTALIYVGNALHVQGDFYTKESPAWVYERQEAEVMKLVVLAYLKVALDRFLAQATSLLRTIGAQGAPDVLSALTKFVDVLRQKEMVEAYLCRVAAKRPGARG